MQETLTSEQDITKLVRDEYGTISGASHEQVTVYEKGDSRVHIFTPLQKENEVIELLRGRNCRITRRCKRTRNTTDVVLEVMVGETESGDVYANNFKQEEIYSGEPFRTI